MPIVILILKILGIVLLSIFGVLLFFILILLFVPIRYVAFAETKQLDYHIELNVNWCIFVISFRLNVQSQELEYQCRIFGFYILKYPLEEKAHKKKKNHRKKDKKMIPSLPEPDERTDDYEEYDKIDNTLHNDDSKSEVLHEAMDTKPKQPKQTQSKKSNKKNHGINVKDFFDTLVKIFSNIKSGVYKASDKIKYLKRLYKKVKAQVTSEKNKESVKHIWKEITYLFKHYSPRKIKLDAHFSTTDPALTGQIMGIICMLPFIYENDVRIIPDFLADTYDLEAKMNMKGHIRLIHLACSAIRILLDKNIMKWIRKKF